MRETELRITLRPFASAYGSMIVLFIEMAKTQSGAILGADE